VNKGSKQRFFEKKRAKNFTPLRARLARCGRASPEGEQKFFGYFFSKK
jgi:hypothetical protein